MYVECAVVCLADHVFKVRGLRNVHVAMAKHAIEDADNFDEVSAVVGMYLSVKVHIHCLFLSLYHTLSPLPNYLLLRQLTFVYVFAFSHNRVWNAPAPCFKWIRVR